VKVFFTYFFPFTCPTLLLMLPSYTRLFDYVDYHASTREHQTAITNADSNATADWGTLSTYPNYFISSIFFLFPHEIILFVLLLHYRSIWIHIPFSFVFSSTFWQTNHLFVYLFSSWNHLIKTHILDHHEMFLKNAFTSLLTVCASCFVISLFVSFFRASRAFAAKLLSAGVSCGDVVCTMLPATLEHSYIFIACLRIGAVFCGILTFHFVSLLSLNKGLDLRLRGEELRSSFKKVKPKAFFFLGKTEIFDFRPLIQDLLEVCSCENIFS